jgi:hypothetical protein
MTIYHLNKFVTVTLIFALTACVSSSTLSSRWHDQNYSGASFKKIFVIALVNKEVNRRALEDKYIERFKKHGVTGIASYTLMTDPKKAYEEKQLRAQLKAIVTKTKVDAVLISHFKGVHTERTEVPPSFDRVPVAHTGDYHRYYHTTHVDVYRPGYTQVDKVATLETKMFAVEGEKLVWDGNTRSFNTKTADKAIKEVTALIVDDIKRSGLIGN